MQIFILGLPQPSRVRKGSRPFTSHQKRDACIEDVKSVAVCAMRKKEEELG